MKYYGYVQRVKGLDAVNDPYSILQTVVMSEQECIDFWRDMCGESYSDPRILADFIRAFSAFEVVKPEPITEANTK
jgi:hypothetical protein